VACKRPFRLKRFLSAKRYGHAGLPDSQRIAYNSSLRNWDRNTERRSTNLYELGVDAKTLQEILRHANVKITEDIYTKPVMDVSREAMTKAQKAFAAKMLKAEAGAKAWRYKNPQEKAA
jgi:integrase